MSRTLRSVLIGLFVWLLAGPSCETVRQPPTSHGFTPLGIPIGECHACGAEALRRCQVYDPQSYPRWLGFDENGYCHAQCTIGSAQVIAGISGVPISACNYRLERVAIRFTGPVCPTTTNLSRGDREFDGHGPFVSGVLRTGASGDQQYLHSLVSIRWTELDDRTRRWAGDGTDAQIRNRLVGTSRVLGSYYRYPPVGVVQGPLANNFGTYMREGTVEFDLEPRNLGVIRIVGDTAGDDISDDDNCDDDARVEFIDYNTLDITIGPIP